MAQIEVLNPVASSVEYKVSPAKRLDSLAGKTIGLYWNIKAGGDVALAHISERLKSRIPGLQFKNYIGPVGAGTRRLTAEMADQIARECQAVIASTAD